MRAPDRVHVVAAAAVAALAAGPLAQPAFAQAPAAVEEQLQALQAELRSQRSLIEAQAVKIREQQDRLDALSGELVSAGELAASRGAGAQPSGDTGPGAAALPPPSPVGEAPEIETVDNQVEAVPQGQGVLTPAGRLVFDPSIEYTNASNNRLVFRGIELVPGIQIGVIEASDVDRDAAIATATVRYGVTDRLELEFRAPYLTRSDRIEVVQLRDGSIVRELKLADRGIGDLEFAARYQFNRPVGQRPIYVGSVRVKSDTGKSPFEIPFDSFGIATGLATGSGFWGIQPGINMLLPSDPAVLYGGVAYLYHIPKTINRTIGDVLVGRVDPGDAVTGNVGFGFALNPRFSYSLGYKHSYIFPTETELGDTTQRSSRLQVGSLNLGMSYRVTPRQVINLGFDIGVTEDAPDLGFTLRMPFGVNLFGGDSAQNGS